LRAFSSILEGNYVAGSTAVLCRYAAGPGAGQKKKKFAAGLPRLKKRAQNAVKRYRGVLRRPIMGKKAPRGLAAANNGQKG